MGTSFVRETDGDIQSLGSVLTNSILFCCSGFHGVASPSLQLLPSLAPVSLHTHKRTFTRTQVSEMGFSHVSKSAGNCCPERESLILQLTLPITTVSGIKPRDSILLFFKRIIKIVF